MAVENDQNEKQQQHHQQQQQQQQIKSNNNNNNFASSSSSSSVSASPSLITINNSNQNLTGQLSSLTTIVNGNCSKNNTTITTSGVTTTITASSSSSVVNQSSSVSIMSNKSETSSNASCNGSTNKKSSSSISSQLSGGGGGGNGVGIVNASSASTIVATSASAAARTTIPSSSSGHGQTVTNNQILLMNSSSREDITSLGGGSSINSQQSTTTQQHKGTNKDNLQHHYYNGSELRYSNTTANNDDDDDDGLGPLPPKWEKAYTENGELYFIDHNTGTSHWLDPRLSKFQKKSLEDCMDDELPYGWEKIHDPQYGTYFIDHVNRRTQYENPVLEAKRRAERNRNEQSLHQQQQHQHQHHHQQQHHHQNSSLHNKQQQHHQQQHHQQHHQQQQHQQQQQHHQLPYTFTRNPSEMRGERITTTLLKSSRGLGITIVGGDDNVDEFLQIKSIVPNGPAWLDGKLQTGDILVYVNDTCVLGFTHHEMVNVFQSILPGETVTLEVCRGYPLPFDPNDPNTEVVTTIAVDGISSDPEKARILMDLNMDGNYNFLDMSDSAGAVGGGGDSNGSLHSGGGGGGDGVGSISQKNPIAKIQAGACGMTAGNNLDFSGCENYIGDEFIMLKKPEILTISIVKGAMGFGFTIADSAYGQKVKKILDRNCCKNLQEGDILLEINKTSVKHMSHSEVVQVLKDCPKTKEALLKVQRGHYYTTNVNLNTRTANKLRKTTPGIKDGGINGSLFRSKTPTADLYSTQPKEILPIRPKTPLVDTRRARVKTPSNELNEEVEAVTRNLEKNDENKSIGTDAKSNNSLQEVDSINNDIPFMDPFPKLVTSLSERLAEASLIQDNHNSIYQHPTDHHHMVNRSNYENSIGGGSEYNYNLPYGNPVVGGGIGMSHNPGGIYSPTAPLPIITPVPTYHQDTCYCFECQDYNRYQMDYHHQAQIPTGNGGGYHHPHHQYIPPMPINQNGKLSKRVNEYIPDRKGGFSPLDNYHSTMVNGPPPPQHFINQPPPVPPLWKYGISPNSVAGAANLMQPITEDEYTLSEVTLERQALGFGFRIVGGTEEGSQVTVGHIVPGGAADGDVGIATGDEILSIDGVNVVNASHHKVVSLMGEAALRGHVTMILRRRVHHSSVPLVRHYPYDVIVNRHENEGFGFVIISSSNQYYGSTIGKLIPGSPADRCGELKVGDRIIAVNRIDIAGMSHGDVVNLIKESGLHVRLTIGCPKETITIPGQTNQILTTSPQPPLLQQPSSQSLITPIMPPQSSLVGSAIKSEQLSHQQQQQQQQSSYSDRSQLIQHPQL